MDDVKMSIVGSDRVQRTRKGRGGKRKNRRPFVAPFDGLDALGGSFERGG